jgi:hypothetical protein
VGYDLASLRGFDNGGRRRVRNLPRPATKKFGGLLVAGGFHKSAIVIAPRLEELTSLAYLAKTPVL